MKTKHLLAVLMLAGLGIAQSQAQEQKTMTVEEYAAHLTKVFGSKGIIISGTVSGKGADGQVATDEFSIPDAAREFLNAPVLMALTIQEAPCPTNQIITQTVSGPYAFPWCAKIQTIGGIAYEAKRDMLYYANGRWMYVTSSRLDCQNATDFAGMPQAVKTAVCP